MNPVQQVIHRTIENFPGYSPDDFRVTAVEKGGSDRKFWRIRAEDRSMILIKYTGQREENRHYVEIAQFLAASGVQVPHVFFHDAAEGLIWMQDLGEEDLWSNREAAWETRRPLYESALIEVFKMHTAATRRLDGVPLRLEREFNEQLYLWEQGYFFEHCLANHFGLPSAEVQRLSGLRALHEAATRLASRPRVLVHRDFQSQNVMVSGGTAWLIDFQGMRPGLAQYDLASLLYDPYVELAAAEREELLAFYIRLARRSGVEIEPDFEDIFHWCAVQRLMQALGAYGFLGLQKGRTDFLRHIPAARRNLREVAAKLDGMDEFVSLLDSLP
ncbi:MAG: phosphotransferase [Terrimicrobiaceae bacterium]|nr:phosphotransferase [Terrimicrobiaceae bacterium]